MEVKKDKDNDIYLKETAYEKGIIRNNYELKDLIDALIKKGVITLKDLW